MPLPTNLIMALVAPVEIGGDVGGWVLVRAVSEREGAVYTLSSGGEQVVVAVEPLDTSRSALTRTTRWNVTVRSAELTTLSPSASRAIVALVRLLKRNEGAVPIPTVSELREHALAVPSRDAPRVPTLWLVPGHIGAALDLSLRGVRVLAGASTWFVEDGKRAGAIEVLAAVGVSDRGRAVIEVDFDQPVEALARLLDGIAARGEDACLFGTNEGIPGFVDPGSSLIEAAARCQPPLRVRSIGGASVLGTALMRIDRDVTFFTFLGHAGSAMVDARISALVSGAARLDRPAIFFAVRDWYRAHAVELGAFVARCRGQVVVLGDLTADDESQVEWTPHLDPEPPALTSRQIVVFVFPAGERGYS